MPITSILLAEKSDMNALPRIARALLLALPALAHFAACFLTGPIDSRLGMLDLVILSSIAAYLGIGCILMRKPYALSRYLLVTYSALLAMFTGELALRISTPRMSQPSPHDQGSTKRHLANTMPGIQGEARWSVSGLGLRGPDRIEYEQAKVRVLCVGGSTTECLFVTDRLSWPWRVQTLLRERVGEEVYVGNAGVSGHFSRHHAYQIRNYKYVSEFDRIIILCGINDLLRFVFDSYESSCRRVPHEALKRHVENFVYYRSLLVTNLVRDAYWHYVKPVGFRQTLNGASYAGARAARQAALSERGPDAVPPGLEQALRRYRQDLKEIVNACRYRQVKPVFLTQPTMYRSSLDAELEALLWMTQIGTTDMAVLMDLYNAELKSFCIEEGVSLVDLDIQLAKDTTVFYDDCHFNVSGCEKVASLLVEFLEADLKSEWVR